MKFNQPKFRYALFLNEQHKSFNKEAKANICFADSFNISEDGSIIFYHSAQAQDKVFKIPVLSYPQGKWEACILIDDKNQYPVFSNVSANTSNIPNPPNSSPPTFIRHENDKETNEVESFSNNSNVNTQNSGGYLNSSNIPGVSNNTEDFKKSKNNFLEKHIKDFIKNNDMFIVSEFLNFVSKQPDYKQFKSSEVDISWAASGLIKDKLVLPRKFSDPTTQKTLSLILPDIMRRQYDGKLAPILTILQDREETKNVTPIDLSVWMSQNGF